MEHVKTLGFIGMGVMGRGMARNLLAAGYPLHVYTRRQQTAQEIIALGGTWQPAVAAVARSVDVLITMVGYPTDVEHIYLSDDGIVACARPGTVVVDMTTSSPALAKRIYDRSAQRHIRALDAPVSGGDVGARDGRLAIMVGGDAATFSEVLPIFQAMGQNILLQGAAGAGQYTKMCNQIVIASTMMGVCEALAYADKAGLDANTVLTSIGAGAAGGWSLNNLGPRIIQGDFAPGFYVKHFIKDMRIAIESADEMGLALPGLQLARSLYDELAAMGESESGTQALYKLIVRGVRP